MNNAGELSSRDRLQNVTEDQNLKLMQPIFTKEVNYAVFLMHPEKFPGYDGLNPTFYQAYWSILEKRCGGVLSEFF